jgi:hypothetical protein
MNARNTVKQASKRGNVGKTEADCAGNAIRPLTATSDL